MVRTTFAKTSLSVFGVLIVLAVGANRMPAGDSIGSGLTDADCYASASTSCPPGSLGGQCFTCTKWQVSATPVGMGVGTALVPNDCGYLMHGTCIQDQMTGVVDCRNTQHVISIQIGHPVTVLLVMCQGKTALQQVPPQFASE